MRPAAVAAAAGAVAVVVALPATAAAAVYQVTAAQHTSSSEKTEPAYTGRSTARWRLARATAAAPNRLTLTALGRSASGSATVNVTGAYGVAVTTARSDACSFTARTGDRAHPLVAPRRVLLTIGPHPDDPRKVAASFTGVHATLANPYLGSECSTDVRGEPGAGETALRTVSRAVLRRKRFTLRFTGRTVRDGVTYRWSTTFRLARRG